jgi:hypothetical protein
MNQNNRITPLSNNPDNNYDENFPFIDINYTQEIFANMLANLILDSEPIVPEIETTLNNTLNEKNPIKYVISEDEQKKLEIVKFKNILRKDENEACSITQETFKDDDEVIQLPCSHCFHKDAILNWLTKEKGECPVCRYKFECMEIKPEPEQNSSLQEDTRNQLGMQYNDFANYRDEFFILPSYLANEPQTQHNNQAYFDFFRTRHSNDN